MTVSDNINRSSVTGTNFGYAKEFWNNIQVNVDVEVSITYASEANTRKRYNGPSISAGSFGGGF